jgi:hypothetical protein
MKLGDAFAVLTATNIGHRTVTVRDLTFELPSGGRLYTMATMARPGMANTPLPAILSDGESARLYMAYREIGEALLQSGRTEKTDLTPVAEDSAGGIYKGKPWKRIDPHEFARM